MRKGYYLVFFILTLISSSCLDQIKTNETVSWMGIDSVFQYAILQPGKERFAIGDPIALEIKAALSRNNGAKVDTAIIPRGCLQFAYSAASAMILRNANGNFHRSEQGMLKADFSSIDLRENFVLFVYLHTNAKKSEADSILKYLERQPEVQLANYISKDEAKKRWMDMGEDDFSEFLEENPLPASIELKINPEYLNATSIKEFVTRVNAKFSDQAISIRYNTNLIAQLDCLQEYIFVISYKT